MGSCVKGGVEDEARNRYGLTDERCALRLLTADFRRIEAAVSHSYAIFGAFLEPSVELMGPREYAWTRNRGLKDLSCKSTRLE
jgi:hypothetical protein